MLCERKLQRNSNSSICQTKVQMSPSALRGGSVATGAQGRAAAIGQPPPYRPRTVAARGGPGAVSKPARIAAAPWPCRPATEPSCRPRPVSAGKQSDRQLASVAQHGHRAVNRFTRRTPNPSRNAASRCVGHFSTTSRIKPARSASPMLNNTSTLDKTSPPNRKREHFNFAQRRHYRFGPTQLSRISVNRFRLTGHSLDPFRFIKVQSQFEVIFTSRSISDCEPISARYSRSPSRCSRMP